MDQLVIHMVNKKKLPCNFRVVPGFLHRYLAFHFFDVPGNLL